MNDTIVLRLVIISCLSFLFAAYALLGPVPLLACLIGVACLTIAGLRSYRNVRSKGNSLDTQG